MRIANNIIFIAVVSLAASAVGWHRRPNSSEELNSLEEVSSEYTWRSHKESQQIIMNEGGKASCCPFKVEMVEPVAGTNIAGMYVKLFREGENKQRFFEISCNGSEGKPCRFLDRKLHNYSKCVQRYSYTYAIVKNYTPQIRHENHQSHDSHQKYENETAPFPVTGTDWVLDYIKIRSGCSCEIYHKKKRSSKSKRGKSKRESDEESQ